MNHHTKNLSVEQLAGMIDHTFLKAFGNAGDIEKLCAEARKYRFAAVAVNPVEVETCIDHLTGSGVRICTVVGFPLGQTNIHCKLFEARDAIFRGVSEIDMVINIRALQKGQTDIVRREIEEISALCKSNHIICKVILETCYLSGHEKEAVCLIAKDAGVDFVKTSTGFGTAGATVADVRLMRRVVGDEVGVKASGGIRDLETTLALIEAGATRIGTSSGVAIIESYKQLIGN